MNTDRPSNKMQQINNEAIRHLFANMTNSQWNAQNPDKSEIGDGWVHNYFQYPNRQILARLNASKNYMAKKINLPDHAISDFVRNLDDIGIKEFVMLEVFDCDSHSMKPDVALKLYLKVEDYERVIVPRLVRKLDMDFHDVTGLNDPERVILLGNTPIKKTQLQKYWEIVGADTDEKRMWNVPTYEQLIKTLELNQD